MEKQIITCFFIVPSFLRVFFFFGFCNSLELLLRFVQCIVVHDMLYLGCYQNLEWYILF